VYRLVRLPNVLLQVHVYIKAIIGHSFDKLGLINELQRFNGLRKLGPMPYGRL